MQNKWQEQIKEQTLGKILHLQVVEITPYDTEIDITAELLELGVTITFSLEEE